MPLRRRFGAAETEFLPGPAGKDGAPSYVGVFDVKAAGSLNPFKSRSGDKSLFYVGTFRGIFRAPTLKDAKAPTPSVQIRAPIGMKSAPMFAPPKGFQIAKAGRDCT